jgi:hypothetical protein
VVGFWGVEEQQCEQELDESLDIHMEGIHGGLLEL